MSVYTYGKRDEFAKLGDNIRQNIVLPASANVEYTRDQLYPYVDPFSYLDKNYSETIMSFGDICFFLNKKQNEYIKSVFKHNEYIEPVTSCGGIVWTVSKRKNDFVEYVFWHYPYVGYRREDIISYGGIVYISELNQNDVG